MMLAFFMAVSSSWLAGFFILWDINFLAYWVVCCNLGVISLPRFLDLSVARRRNSWLLGKIVVRAVFTLERKYPPAVVENFFAMGIKYFLV